MNHYELLAIISGKYAESEVSDILHATEEIVKKHASAFHYSQNLERKKLAYPILHHSYGTYILMEFDCNPKTIKALEDEIRHTHELIRSTIVRREKVGTPKELERKEQKTSPYPSTHPAQTPTVAYTHPRVPHYIPASPVPVVQILSQTPLQPSLEPSQTKPLSPIDLDTVIDSPPEVSHTEQVTEQVEDSKKKQKKVTYEELDKKLDEILNNTIL